MAASGILRKIIRECDIKVMAEIGVYKKQMLRRIMQSEENKLLREYWAIDPWKELDERYGGPGNLSQGDWDSLYWRACKYMPYRKQLRILRLTSEEASQLFPLPQFKGHFDLVYIDASHFYEDVVNDIKCWLPLVKEGKYIGGHDYNKGSAKGHDVKRAVLQFFKEEDLELFGGGVWLKKV